jgi:hypothetical protein
MSHLTRTANLSLSSRLLKGALLVLTAAGLTAVPLKRSMCSDLMDITKIQTIPHYGEELSEEDFIAKSKLIEEDPEKDPTMAYSMRLPQDWTKSGERDQERGALPEGIEKPQDTEKKSSGGQRVLGKVARYLGPPQMDFNSRIEVRAMKLEHDISARNWFLNFIMSQGYTLQGMEQVNEYRLVALYNLVEDGVPYVVRTLAEMNGPRMVVVSYYLPEIHWMQDRAIQERVISSFAFKKPEKTLIEKTQTYKFLELLRFDYPKSWILHAPNIYSIEGMDARLVNTSDNVTLNGEIRLSFVSTELDTTLSTEIGYLKEDMEKIGIKIGKLIETPVGYNFHDHIFFNRVEVYETEAQKGIEEHEFWLAVMVEDRYYYIISMLTPSRNADFLTWAQNIESFQIVIESIQP